jgi:hypothetical protein
VLGDQTSVETYADGLVTDYSSNILRRPRSGPEAEVPQVGTGGAVGPDRLGIAGARGAGRLSTGDRFFRHTIIVL